MASTLNRRTCLRCHAKKIRCTGYPDCRNCINASVTCEKYTRIRKSETHEALVQARQRVKWLEHELLINFDTECQSLSTGTPLKPSHATPDSSTAQNVSSSVSRQGPRAHSQVYPTADLEPQQSSDSEPVPNDAPDISLLALNATGETKYLGPSSGAFFAAYAAAIARSFISDQGPTKRSAAFTSGGRPDSLSTANPREELRMLSSTDVKLLLRSYRMWIHPLYPLLSPKSLESLAAQCSDSRVPADRRNAGENEIYCEMAIFYLVMALGAINYTNTIKHINENNERESTREPPRPDLSHHYFYSMALKYFDRNIQHLQTNISAITIVLLICIYSSYGRIGSSQWQLSGTAMRMAVEMGLHYAPNTHQISTQKLDQRSRVFWTAYAIETSLAYNLGRPPSIGEEYITATLPSPTADLSLGIHHIKHRQIQSRIVSQVYGGLNRVGSMTVIERQRAISNLQSELDAWKDSLGMVYQMDRESPYPFNYWDRLYHGTSFVLHRSSPLCPRPSDASLEQCIRSAGSYIECMTEVLRNSHVPLSWMLVQGVLFAGLTMLITARTSFHILLRRAGLSLLLVDLPSWARKCSICFAIVNERWNEDLLSRLDTQFEALVNDTLRLVSANISSLNTDSFRSEPLSIREVQQVGSQNLLPTVSGQDAGQPLQNTAAGNSSYPLDDLDQNNLFREFLGIEDDTPIFWDTFLFHDLDVDLGSFEAGADSL